MTYQIDLLGKRLILVKAAAASQGVTVESFIADAAATAAVGYHEKNLSADIEAAIQEEEVRRILAKTDSTKHDQFLGKAIQ